MNETGARSRWIGAPATFRLWRQRTISNIREERLARYYKVGFFYFFPVSFSFFLSTIVTSRPRFFMYQEQRKGKHRGRCSIQVAEGQAPSEPNNEEALLLSWTCTLCVRSRCALWIISSGIWDALLAPRIYWIAIVWCVLSLV